MDKKVRIISPSGSQTWLLLLVTRGTFSKGYCSNPTPRYSDLIGSRKGQDTGTFKSSPGKPNTQAQ